ncbi:MAG: class I SAM-dependent methyltransferase [Chloroflexi bacterium]|nr:class I SAM-dependent methyltransferase [Chloroflexota bacterium]
MPDPDSDTDLDTNPFDTFARLYDWEHDQFDQDVTLYLALVRRFGGPVLELACGTGRVLATLASAGFGCTGVDSSPAMLERAAQRLRDHALSAQLVQQRVEELHLDRTFRTILWPLDGLGLLLTRAAQLAALRAARACISHDGRLVLDLANGNLRGGELPEELQRHLTAPDPSTGRLITKWSARRSDPAEQLDELTFLYDETDEDRVVHRTTVQLSLRWFTRWELELLLERAGWEQAELYGGYALESYGPSSERLLVVARPARQSTEGRADRSI